MTQSLNGRRYINLVRCSTDLQTGTSVPGQLQRLNAFGQQHGMIHVDDVILAGVSGSVPTNRKDIAELIRRKQRKNDFEYVLVYDLSRFTRSGAMHGFWMEAEFAQAGIRLEVVADNLPKGRFSKTIRTLKYESDHEAVRTHVESSQRGMHHARRSNRMTPTIRPPYGIDRLYTTADGAPLHIIHNLPDGTQEKLHPETRALVDKYGANDRNGGGYRHYRKQKDECVFFVLGDPDHVKIVRQIFSRRFLEGIPIRRIAAELNDRRVHGPRCPSWGVDTITHMLVNPYYIGRAAADRTTSARYVRPGEDHPIPVNLEDDDVALFRVPAPSVRPRDEWFERDQPHLLEMLEPKVRALAQAHVAKHLESFASGRKEKRRLRPAGSQYLLTSILRSKQGNHLLTGMGSYWKAGKKWYRYYMVSRGLVRPRSDSAFNKCVPVEVVEDAVLDAVRATLSSREVIEKRVVEIVRGEIAEQSDVEGTLRLLEKRRGQIKLALEVMCESLSKETQSLIGVKLAQLQSELSQVTKDIARWSGVQRPLRFDEKAIVKSVVQSCVNMATQFGTMPRLALNRLLRCLIPTLAIDLETFDLEMVVALPKWEISQAGNSVSMFCADTGLSIHTPASTKAENHGDFARFRWTWVEAKRVFRLISRQFSAKPTSA